MDREAPISATYRLQFNKDFTFRDATKLLDYFADLGITDPTVYREAWIPQ